MPSDSYPLVEELAIARLVGPLSLSRGRTVERAGAVHDLAWDASAFRLSAAVDGTGPGPYRVEVRLDLGVPGRTTILSGTCTCPVSRNCKHVAAVLLASGERHRLDEAPPAPAAPVDPAEPEWRSALNALTATATATDVEAAPRQPLALQFELRERVTRRGARQAARDEPATNEGAVERLAVRPVTRGARGGWIKANLTWQNVGFQGRAGGFDPRQARWFAEFSMLKGTRHAGFGEYGSAWISLDEYESATLWALLAAAPAHGIELVGTGTRTEVSVGAAADIGLEVRRAELGPEAIPTTEESEEPAADGPIPIELASSVTVDGERHPSRRARLIGDHGVYVFDFARGRIVLAPLAAPLRPAARAAVRRREPIVVPADEVASFTREQYPVLARSLRISSDDPAVDLPDLPPATLVATLAHEPGQLLRVGWEWEADGGRRLPFDVPDAEFHDPDLERRPAIEAAGIAAEDPAGAPLLRIGAGDGRPDPALRPMTLLRGIEAAEFSTRVLPRLRDVERLRVEESGEAPEYRELTEAPRLAVTAVESERTDWFDLGVIVTVEGKKVPFGPLFRALSRGQKKLLLVDHSYLSLDHEVFGPLRELLEEAGSLDEWETGELAIHRTQTALWSEFEDLADESEAAVSWRETVAGLRSLDRIEPVSPPAGLALELRPYQLEGFRWLAFLHRHRLGGILADDMGLGKTAQTLALVAHAREQDASEPPFLVVAPTSVVSNWAREASRFVPGLEVATVTATQAASRVRLADAIAGADVVVTSYAILRLDAEAFAEPEWAGLVLDEAQFVKNGNSKANQAARDIRAPFRLAVTGTPVENNLMELWALMKIVAPGLFPSARAFAERYRRPIENDRNTERLATLRRRIRPLVLRRTKELVAPELPEKQEQVLTVALDPAHRRIYDTFLQRERQKLLGLIDDLDRNRFTIFRSLTLLRMLSLSPALIDSEQYADVPSAKLDALFEQLDEVVAEGHRALVFSQFTSFLRLAAERLDAAGVPYAYLDGATRQRSEVIDRFRTGGAPVFLISLKAGGFGLNLTEADYVFLLDPWWNPASEAQAVDRAHRIGQSSTVMVYRLVAEETIEEKVMALKEKKAALVSSVMDDEELFASALTADDLRGLIQP